MAWERFVRRKGHIPPRALWVLAFVASVPLVMVLARIAALPGVDLPPAFGGEALRLFGGVLNRSFSLEWVPPGDRWGILYILLLPTAALLIALARLTFGLRVLGFRSILIAVGFQEIGIVPSLLLMALVVAIIVALRPPMRRMQLTFYARTSVILCIAAMVMVAGLILGPWLRSEMLWSFAFFPVIILALLGESIAATLARDDAWSAGFRAGSTVLVAFIIAFVSWIPAVREIALRFPELMVTQLVAIVFISEFLDLRLLEAVPARLAGRVKAATARFGATGRLKVAVVRNRVSTNVIGRLGRAASPRNRTQSVQVIVDALREQGFEARTFEGDMSLLHELQQFMPADPASGAPGGIVLNLAAGLQGQGRSCHLPAMLEMAGVPYTGPDPIAQARLLDRYALLMLLRQAGVPTPRFRLLQRAGEDLGELRFPLIVRPRYEPDATLVKDRRALDKAVRRIVKSYEQDALVETLEKGSEIRVALLGNDSVECLPLLEIDPAGKRKGCPAPLDEALAERIRDCARAAYLALGCRDYARIDIRLSARGKPQVFGIHTVGIFARKGSVALAAEKAGYAFGELMRRVVDVAWKRYAIEPAVQVRVREATDAVVVHLEPPRAAGTTTA